ncbi:hypothetical protein B0T22DRAFT_30358 [Podospora appendiculata]|uniref:Uncharacterized protein n=1 Tax=Podospora appendiculata TaxID=314037 RepID=A0AAE0XH53_9PEZI|nr:hypothetical protein B0T22DRAFT_30358 [Podospora appendiculata]
MTVPNAFQVALGAIALLTTTAILVMHIILARSVADSISQVRITATIAATFESLVLITISLLACSYIKPTFRLRSFNGIWFGAGLILCTTAAAVSVASLICLSNAAANLGGTILGSTATGFSIGSSVALGLAFAGQLIFLVFHFIITRIQGHRGTSDDQAEEDRSSQQPRQIKSVPYHHTVPNAMKTRDSGSIDWRSPPGSRHSAAETMSSFRSSLSNVVRPITSKTRLLPGSQKPYRRPASLESAAMRELRPISTEDGFDSWDTSSVDPQNRQTVMESSSPPTSRFLETIPASPTVSRSPSPGTPFDLELPRTRHRSRSFSPAATRTIQAQRAAFTQQSTQSESHIHPLFRSDSPTPPPFTTPGTVVTAAPNAGHIIMTDKQSIRSLARMRSGSFPAVSSPLSRQSSFDSFRQKVNSSSPELIEEAEGEATTPDTERKMTPPIPDWILSAGSRTSLTGYNSRKIRILDGGEAAGQI